MIIGWNLLLLIGCIALIILILNMHKYSKGLVVASRVVGILAIVYSVFQQGLTLLIGGFLVSLSDGNGLNKSAANTFVALLFIPVAIIAAAIVLLVVSKKKADR